jgi:hypothetical protein
VLHLGTTVLIGGQLLQTITAGPDLTITFDQGKFELGYKGRTYWIFPANVSFAEVE